MSIRGRIRGDKKKRKGVVLTLLRHVIPKIKRKQKENE